MNTAQCPQLILIPPSYKASLSFNQRLRFTLRQITIVRRHFRLYPIGCSPNTLRRSQVRLRHYFTVVHPWLISSLQESCLMLIHFRCLPNVGCCRAVHSFPRYIHSNIMVNNPNCIPDRTQFSDLFIQTAQCSHISASTKHEISLRALLNSFE
jgi:hypothetical protein